MKTNEENKTENQAEMPPDPPQPKNRPVPKDRGGECSGFMEYVIIAVVIAAAAALVFAIWGKSIVGQASASAAAYCGKATAAAECQSAAQQDACRATESNKKFSDGEKCREKWGGVKASTVDPVPIPDDGGASPSDEFKKKFLK